MLGTPGQGDFAFLPPPSREYTALELSLTGNSRDVAYRASYVLSRNWGNYSGLYMSDYGIADPGGNFTFYGPWQDTNSTGWLPNDRRHVFKLALSHRERVGLTEGAVVTVASGMPLNAFAPAPASRFFARWAFAVPRGSAGRTPTTWDLNLRFAYAVPWKRVARSRVILDVLHVGNPQRAVWLQEQRYLKNVGGVFSGDNPAYGEPIAYQPPMQARLGIEMSF